MTRCIQTALLLAALALPAAAQAAGGSDTAASGGPPAARPALRARSGQRPPWMAPRASAKIRFQPREDVWTVRTALEHRLTLELSSTGASRSTSLTARRVLLAREELRRTRKGFERTTTLRAVTAERNGRPEVQPAEAYLLGRRLGVTLSRSGKPTGTIGVIAARDAVTEELSGFRGPEDPTGGLADAVPDDDALREGWEADAGRYLGKTLRPGQLVRTVERVRLPFLRGRVLSAVDESRVVGPVVVAGRPGVQLDVRVQSLEPSRVATDDDLADWVDEVRLKALPAGCRIVGDGRRVVALDGRGILEEDMKLEVTLTGALAAEAGNAGPPPGRVRTTARALTVALGRKRTVLSEYAGAPRARSAPDRAASRTERRARPRSN